MCESGKLHAKTERARRRYLTGRTTGGLLGGFQIVPNWMRIEGGAELQKRRFVDRRPAHQVATLNTLRIFQLFAYVAGLTPLAVSRTA